MSEADLELLGGLTITNGLTVTGGTVDFSGASSGGGIELTDISATNAPLGTSSLSYNNTTGVFTYTPPDLSSYATTSSLSNYALTSSLAAVATSGAYADITGTPSLATVATSGAYADLTGTPTVPTTTDNLTEGSTNLYFTNARASSAITGSDLDMGGNKVLFANMYSAEGNLPSATTYHGMFAHVHGTGKGYFAHNGSWHKLLDETSSTTANLTEGTNLYYTDARVDSRLSSGNVATITTSGDITVGGDLTVSGTTTTVNTETINLADNTITLNSNYTGSSPTEDGGIEIERGTLTNKTLVWDETNDKWTVGSETFVAGTFEGNLTGNVTGTVSSLSNHDTDDVSEGASNLYYTDARARAAVSATNAAAGTAALSYNSSTGQFTLTPPDLSSYATTASLATVATSGAYSDLTGTPSLSGYLTDITGESLSDLSDVASTTPTDGQVLTYDTTNGWQPETPSSGGGSISWIASSNTSSAGTPGAGGIALGGNTSVGADAVSVGNYAVASASESVAVGSSQSSTAHLKTNVTGSYGVGIGSRAQVHGNGGISMGWQAEAGTSTKAWSMALGNQALSQYEKSVAIGYSAATTADNQLMLGGTTTNGFTSVQVGNTSYTPTVANDLTTKNYVDTAISSAGGLPGAAESTTTTAATATGTSALAVGYDVDAGGNYSTAVGFQANAGSTSAIALGYLANADTGNQTIAIGQSTNSTGTYAISLGLLANATHNYSAAIGYYATTGQANQLMLGRNSTTNGFTSIRVGNTSYSPSDNLDLATKGYVDTAVAGAGGGSTPQEIAFGSGGSAATSTGTESLAIGSGATTGSAPYSIAIGDGANVQNTIGYNIGIGWGTNTTARYNTLVGGNTSSSSTSNFSVGIGWSVTNSAAYTTTVGSYASCGNYSNGLTAIGTYSISSGNSSVAVGCGYSTTYCTKAYSSGQAFGALAYSQSAGLAIGYSAYQTGYQATAVGTNTVSLQTNGTALGNGASTSNSNQVVLGNSSISDLRCQDTSITAVSDRRDKTDIETLAVGLDFVNAVEPVAFYKNNRNDYYVAQYTQDEICENPELEQTYTFDQTSYDAGTHKFDKREFGFIAQDVAAQLPAEYSDARVSYNETDAKHGHDVQRFTMGDMTPILWKALRELSDKHDQLQADYDALLARVVALENA